MRGLGDPAVADRFLNPSLDHLHDPFLLADMDRAVARLERALANGERIAIHGDYDVDGITSTVILRRALEMLGGKVDPLHPRTPARRLRPAAGGDRSAARREASTSSCRSTAASAAPTPRGARASWGSTSSSPITTSPKARCRRRCRRDQSQAPRLHLSGQAPRRRRRRAEARAGAVHARRQERSGCRAFVKIAALGTLADVVPLVGENRVIARFGLESLIAGTAHHRPALAARGLGADRQDDRQLPGRVHRRAARQRRRAHEHARTSRRGSCSPPTRAWRTKPAGSPSS